MATKNVAAQASKKKNTGSLSLRCCEASVTYSKLYTKRTRSMAAVAAPTIAR